MPAIKRILVPADFSPCLQAALGYGYGASLANQLGVSVEVFHVWPAVARAL